MYTVFIPKYEYDSTPFRITKVISTFMKNSCCDCIISSPGYLSTTSNTIKTFLANLNRDINNSKKIYISFLNGMNGARLLSNNNTIRQEHVSLLGTTGYLYPLITNCIDYKDHRKMMFFIDCNGNVPGVLDKNNYNSFIDSSRLLGVLIGSSNQSLNTYYGGSNSRSADKGEADILMYIDPGNTLTPVMNDLHQAIEEIRISRSIDESLYSGIDADEKYFKRMLKDFLEKNLS
ncbi:MAG: hypothetical protein IKH75_11460 [Ruminococcus sp.]|nr:hypothetical protein [Ruminococcus sp.]